MSVARLPRAEFLELVRRAPLVSIDLILRDAAGRVLLGRRRNAPAQGCWFVPGGRILKGETLEAALARIATEEVGLGLQLDRGRLLGAYTHLYDDNFAGVADVPTHYVVLAYVFEVAGAVPQERDQHSGWRWFAAGELDGSVHAYTRAYFRDLAQ